jgi:hypothetical protein
LVDIINTFVCSQDFVRLELSAFKRNACTVVEGSHKNLRRLGSIHEFVFFAC